MEKHVFQNEEFYLFGTKVELERALHKLEKFIAGNKIRTMRSKSEMIPDRKMSILSGEVRIDLTMMERRDTKSPRVYRRYKMAVPRNLERQFQNLARDIELPTTKMIMEEFSNG